MPRHQDLTTIKVTPEVRDGLKHIARKDQSYNELFIDLIKLHNASVKVRNNEAGAPPP